MRTCIDASVAAKWFNQEDFSEQAVELKDRQVRGDVELVAPALLAYEVGNSIRKNPQLTEGDARDAIISLAALGVVLLPPETGRVGRVMEIARTRRMTFYDAAYLQAAEECQALLITADENQIKTAKGIARAAHIRDLGPV